jgi:hypothetical protein
MNPHVASPATAHRRGGVLMELIVGLALLAGVLLPLAGGFVSQRRMAAQLSKRLVLMELIDGELEFIAAGRWKEFNEGTNSFLIETPAGFVPPAGRSYLIRESDRFRLVWEPEAKTALGTIERHWTRSTETP